MNEKSVGLFISLVRELHGIKQENLANDIGISRPVLSKIENGIDIPNESLIISLFKQLGLDYTEYKKDKKWFYNIFNQYYQSVIYGKQEHDEIYKEVISRTENNFLLKFYPEYKLVLMIDLYIKGQYDEFSSLLNEMVYLERFLDDVELAIYKDYQSIYYMEEGDYEESLEILNSINIGNVLENIHGMVEYHISMNYHYMNNYYLCGQHLQLAMNHFILAQNFNKIIYVQMLMSDVLFKTGNFDLAIKSSQKSLDAISPLPNQNIQSIIKSNIAWYLLVKGEYKESIKYAMDSLQNSENRSECYFYLAFCYYRLQDKSTAIRYIELSEKKLNNYSLDYKMCRALKKFIKHGQNYISYLKRLYDGVDVKEYPGYKQLLLELIISYYKQEENYKEVSKYLYELNKLLVKKLIMFEQ